MDDYQWAAKSVDVPPGTLQFVRPSGANILLANVAGQVYAVSNICTHSRCYLHNGRLDGKVVTCPCHSAQFDVTTGQVLAAPAREPLPTYPVRVEDGSIFVAV